MGRFRCRRWRTSELSRFVSAELEVLLRDEDSGEMQEYEGYTGVEHER